MVRPVALDGVVAVATEASREVMEVTVEAAEEAVTAAEANRRFSELLRRVRQGRRFVVTSHGRPVAKLVPAEEQDDLTLAARERLFARLKEEPASDIGPWTRAELYGR